MNDLHRILSRVDEEIMAAVVAVNADRKATPLLRAAVDQVWNRSRRTIGNLKRSGCRLKPERAREISQACAVSLAFADSLEGLSEKTRSALQRAHGSVTQLTQLSP